MSTDLDGMGYGFDSVMQCRVGNQTKDPAKWSFRRDVNEPGPSPKARKPAGTFPSPPGPQPAFFSPHLQIHQKK